ncbi:hypothetical protein [Nocardiopsis gilva]|uniref:hypothetical protein n=1 Tax=Nocardiopsis gilva TaxID=280236 RepID=UPI00373AF4F4
MAHRVQQHGRQRGVVEGHRVRRAEEGGDQQQAAPAQVQILVLLHSVVEFHRGDGTATDRRRRRYRRDRAQRPQPALADGLRAALGDPRDVAPVRSQRDVEVAGQRPPQRAHRGALLAHQALGPRGAVPRAVAQIEFFPDAPAGSVQYRLDAVRRFASPDDGAEEVRRVPLGGDEVEQHPAVGGQPREHPVPPLSEDEFVGRLGEHVQAENELPHGLGPGDDTESLPVSGGEVDTQHLEFRSAD